MLIVKKLYFLTAIWPYKLIGLLDLFVNPFSFLDDDKVRCMKSCKPGSLSSAGPWVLQGSATGWGGRLRSAMIFIRRHLSEQHLQFKMIACVIFIWSSLIELGPNTQRSMAPRRASSIWEKGNSIEWYLLCVWLMRKMTSMKCCETECPQSCRRESSSTTCTWLRVPTPSAMISIRRHLSDRYNKNEWLCSWFKFQMMW